MFSPTTTPASQFNIKQILSEDTISARIDSLTKFFTQAVLREQHAAFPVILANIFGYDHTQGWGLTKLTPTSDPVTHRVVSSFIEPGGILFNLTGKLEQANMYYEFPLICLPPPSQSSILSPVKFTLDFYNNKLPQLPPGTLPSQLKLRAYDFFFFHFAYFLIYSQHLTHINPSPGASCVWASISTCLYTSMLEAYLNHFLPLQAVKNRSSPVHSMFSSPNRHKHSPSAKIRQNTSLLNLEMLTESPYKSNSTAVELQVVREAGGLGMRFLETLVEFWLRQVESSSPLENFFGRGSQQHTHFMTEAHARFSRILCKHLHFWTALSPDPHSSPSSLSYVVLRQPLFQFLRYCIANWPQEPSFRMLVELWLTHIQPWRYENIQKQAKSGHATNECLSGKWFDFVSTNLPFYSTLFLEFLPRAFRLNLTHNRDVTVLSRVMRVFSQPGLPQMIKQAEGMLADSRLTSHRSRISPEKYDLQIHIVDLIWNMNTFTPMMTLSTIQAVEEIRKSIDNMVCGLPDEFNDTIKGEGILSRLRQWMSKFVEVEEDDDDIIVNGDKPDKTKLKQTLQQCVHYFDCLFETSNQSLLKNELDSTLNDSRTSPIQNSEVLNRKSLNENLMNNTQNILKLNYMGDPVLRAIQPHESKFLCRNLHKLSLYLNRKFEPQLAYVSVNEDLLISQFASLFLNERPPPSPFERPGECGMPRLRINLRPFSSYKTLALIFLFYCMPYLCGITSFQSILLSLIILASFVSLPLILFNK
ncbi:Sphingomyelin phosphodiesterase 4-like [Oopsacas minuta]|uniref:Sphingomyelin phosphodiesterase 4-like n=1 Tax=Oopsacas minuta TaxID=111878 RepID=A0AAV7JKT0_9METZ|nr:Sphingomyelin phosphodiesterase 4-like [Oopsacas minuta]